LGDTAAAGDLDRHEAAQLGIAGLVDGAEGADAELLQKLELSEAFGGLFGQPAGGAAVVELDAGAAGRADDFARRLAFEDNHALAMRALEGHGGNSTQTARFQVG